MAEHIVFVAEEEGGTPFGITVDENGMFRMQINSFLLLSSLGNLPLSLLREYYPEATGLRYRVGGRILAVFSKEQV